MPSPWRWRSPVIWSPAGGAADAPRRRGSAREGASQAVTDLAAAGAVAAVLASGAGLGARPLSPAVLAFAALLTMTMFEVAGVARRGRPRGGPGPRRVAAAQRDDRAGRAPGAR